MDESQEAQTAAGILVSVKLLTGFGPLDQLLASSSHLSSGRSLRARLTTKTFGKGTIDVGAGFLSPAT